MERIPVLWEAWRAYRTEHFRCHYAEYGPCIPRLREHCCSCYEVDMEFNHIDKEVKKHAVRKQEKGEKG